MCEMENRMTPKAIRINMGLTREEMAEKLNHYVKMTKRMYICRENGINEWSGLEIIALAKVAGISDVRTIRLK